MAEYGAVPQVNSNLKRVSAEIQLRSAVGWIGDLGVGEGSRWGGFWPTDVWLGSGRGGGLLVLSAICGYCSLGIGLWSGTPP